MEYDQDIVFTILSAIYGNEAGPAAISINRNNVNGICLASGCNDSKEVRRYMRMLFESRLLLICKRVSSVKPKLPVITKATLGVDCTEVARRMAPRLERCLFPTLLGFDLFERLYLKRTGRAYSTTLPEQS
jgi:hypothetical protein